MNNPITNKKIDLEYQHFIIDKAHPCIMANSVFKNKHYQLNIYNDIFEDEAIEPILSNFANYLENYDCNSQKFESFFLCFKNNRFQTELEFEKAMWGFLQKLHNKDDSCLDKSVSSNPDDATFSFSIKGRAFYVVGMHPKSSRLSRRAPYVTLVFNLHQQFEKLRDMGTFDKVKSRIRNRDEVLQGSINPVLRDYGAESETKQYSGRAVDQSWRCPFQHR